MKKFNCLINKMLINGVHLGHKKNLLNPLMKDSIIDFKYDISIINLEKTYILLKNSINIVEELTKLKKIILFVCTKKKTSEFLKSAAESVNMPYVNHRWLGGTLTNFKSIKNSINRMNYTANLILNKKKFNIKKRKLIIYRKKLKKSRKALEGIKSLTKIPDLLIIIDSNIHKNTIIEAKKKNIPTICVVDTDSSPSNITYAIPGNDDSFKSITFYINIFITAITKYRSWKNEYK